ncbi:MAG: hypothetical protein L0271_10500 [Gemmatimonadetes bacterium]|nr:hypothetical protein [Gemmatimonadota bacterium]
MRKWFAAVVVIAGLVPVRAAAQIAWDSPMLLPPGSPVGFSVFLVDVHGGDLGVMGLWRSPSWNFGLRVGIAEGPGDDIGVYGGIDFAGRMTRATDEFPLDIDWVFGAGIGATDGGALVSLPLGLTAGHDFEGDGVGFLPYVTPRVILDACLDCGRRGDNDDVSLDFAADIGLDLRVSRRLTIRFGATLGDRDGVAVGLMF